MNAERMRCIISGLKRFKLTEAETEFICFAEQDLNQIEPLSETPELILERIYRQKTKFIRHSIISMLKQNRPVTPVSHVVNRRLHPWEAKDENQT